MRECFEAASISLIGFDTYHRSIRSAGHNANVSSIDFKAGRISSGIDLRMYPKEDFIKLSQEQRDELMSWLRTDEGVKQNTLNFKLGRKKEEDPRSTN